MNTKSNINEKPLCHYVTSPLNKGSNIRPMKDSGIQWIGQIPEDWKICKIKHLLQSNKDGIKIGPFGSSLTNKVLDKDEGNYKIYGQWNIVKSDFSAGKNYISQKTFEELISYQVYPYDVLISMMGTIGKCTTIPNGIVPGIMDSHVIKARLNNGIILNKFFEYEYDKDCSNFIYEQILKKKTGSIMDGLNSSIVKNLYFLLPPIAEQTRIADFLDQKCSAIDSVLEKTRASIEEYKKLKQSVITRAVTKGIRPNRQMKDSGIEWIGQIPEDWEIKRLKALFEFGKGLPITKENLIDEGLSVISYGQIHSKTNSGVKIQDDLIRYVANSYLESNPSSLVHKGDFIFADTSEDLEGCGNCVFINEETTLFAGYHTIIFKAKYEKNNRYLAYLFKTDNWRSQIRSKVTGVKLFSISRKILSGSSVLLPPIAEQQAIADYLDTKCTEIDNLIAKKEQFVKEIETYKKSLIYEYVTGKKEVL